jgi:hypothetical protein
MVWGTLITSWCFQWKDIIHINSKVKEKMKWKEGVQLQRLNDWDITLCKQSKSTRIPTPIVEEIIDLTTKWLSIFSRVVLSFFLSFFLSVFLSNLCLYLFCNFYLHPFLCLVISIIAPQTTVVTIRDHSTRVKESQRQNIFIASNKMKYFGNANFTWSLFGILGYFLFYYSYISRKIKTWNYLTQVFVEEGRFVHTEGPGDIFITFVFWILSLHIR